MKMTGNTILITGGGTGIGRGLAEAFHTLGNRVIITGRREAVLAEVAAANPGMTYYTLDVDSPADITAFAQRVTQENPALNILINNAGIMTRVELSAEGIDLAAAEATVTTNILGPIRLIAALLPHLKQQTDAAIVNLTSGLAFVPLASAAAYSATKAAMHSYTVSLRQVLAPAGVEVIELAPPGVRTSLTPGQEEIASYMPLDAFISEVMALFAQQPTPPEICVKAVKFLRDAEANGQFERAVELLNPQPEYT